MENLLVSGPMLAGSWRGERLGACTDCRRFWARYRAGEITDLTGVGSPYEAPVDPELKTLQEENARLKKIIGNQALELEFKTELLKKNEAYERRRKGS